MKKKRGRPEQARGSTRMREFGYLKCEVWFDESEASMVQEAARKADKRLASWVRLAAVQAAFDGLLPVQRPEQKGEG